MRILGRLPDARMQISVFENDGRFPVQFELGGITQVYRFRKGLQLPDLGHLKEYIDEPFRLSVLEEFERMRGIHNQVLQQIAPPTDPLHDLPDIL